MLIFVLVSYFLLNRWISALGAIHLSNPLAKLCRGPVWLNLSQCGLSAKGVAQLAHALVLNRCAPNSLTHLNLSGNSLKDDINVSPYFIHVGILALK
jgi:hypothetical protein